MRMRRALISRCRGYAKAALIGLVISICMACDFQTDEGGAMRIQFLMEGGIAHFPGLSQPVTIDAAELSQQEATELRRLVEAAGFFDLPARIVTAGRGAADYRQYTVTIEEEERRHTVQVAEPIEDGDLKQLLAFLRTKANEIRRGR
jgi:hypothetical protein